MTVYRCLHGEAPRYLADLDSVNSFQRQLKTFLFAQAFERVDF